MKLKVKYKKKSKKKKKFKKYSSNFLEESHTESKKLSPSNLAKIMIVLGFIFLIISFHFIYAEFKKTSKKNYKLNENSEKIINNKTDNNITNNISTRYLFEQNQESDTIEICHNANTKHICYKYPQGLSHNLYYNKDEIICLMENVVLDPSKLIINNFDNNNNDDNINKEFVAFSKGFINTDCNPIKDNIYFNNIYKTYFNYWNYGYDIEKEKEPLEELASGKNIFLIMRNEVSSNLFGDYLEIMNIINMINLNNLSQEKIQLLIISGKERDDDSFDELYKNIFPKGNKPIYIRNLKKKYIISKAINILFSPFIYKDYLKNNSMIKIYQSFKDFVDKYMNIKPFKDIFISDNITYYPHITIQNYEKGIKFIRNVTILWRKESPNKRNNRTRLLINKKQLADKLAQKLPNNFLIRNINIEALTYKDQISLMKNTDYLLGISEVDLSLTIFLNEKAILHEVYQRKNNNLINNKSAFGGLIVYSEYNENEIIEKVLANIKANHFFNR